MHIKNILHIYFKDLTVGLSSDITNSRNLIRNITKVQKLSLMIFLLSVVTILFHTVQDICKAMSKHRPFLMA